MHWHWVSMRQRALLLYFTLCDIVFFATGTAGDVVKQLRPVMFLAVRRTLYLTWSFSAERLGASLKIWGLWLFDMQTSMMSIVAASQCRDWRSLALFVLADWCTMFVGLWCLSGTLQNLAPFRIFRKLMMAGRPSPPNGLTTGWYRGYEFFVESKCLTIAFLGCINMYPICKFVLPYDMLQHFLFPMDDTFNFLLVYGASELLRDHVIFRYVAQNAQYHCDPVFTFANNFLFCVISTGLFFYHGLANAGWMSQVMKVGPFACQTGGDTC